MTSQQVKGQDALGTRYMRMILDGGVQVWVMVDDDEALVEPGLRRRVELAAGLALEELRVSRPPKGTDG